MWCGLMRGRFGVRWERGLRGDSRQVSKVAGAARPRARSARGSGVGIEEHVGAVCEGTWCGVVWFEEGKVRGEVATWPARR